MKYKILVALTFILPISSFILYSAITGMEYDATIYDASTIHVTSYDDGFVVYSDGASYDGYLVPYLERYGLYIEEGDIVKVDREFYTIHEGQWKNFDDVPQPIRKTNNTVISIVSVIGILIVVLIIGGKMDLLKSHPRASVMFSLLLGTLILWGVSSIVSDLLSVFVIATASWGAYLIEYGIHNGKIDKKTGDKLESTLLSALKEMAK